MDWNLIKAFLSVARSGSLSLAAKELDLSQPTLSRQIQALELATELNLFRRSTQGLHLTEQGAALVEAAESMKEAADLFNRRITGLSTELEGDLRISANEIVGVYLLPAALTEFRRRHPGINFDVVISNQASSLNKREADIALRMFRPSQRDLVVSRLPDLELGFYASKSYLAQAGTPKDFEDLACMSFIGFDLDMEMISSAEAMGLALQRQHFSLRSDMLLMQIALMRAGAGIGVTHTGLAERYPELEPVLQELPLPALEFWCVCHSDVQYNSRIREFIRFLTQWYAGDPYRHTLI